jgi:hypothetical protein
MQTLPQTVPATYFWQAPFPSHMPFVPHIVAAVAAQAS